MVTPIPQFPNLGDSYEENLCVRFVGDVEMGWWVWLLMRHVPNKSWSGMYPTKAGTTIVITITVTATITVTVTIITIIIVIIAVVLP